MVFCLLNTQTMSQFFLFLAVFAFYVHALDVWVSVKNGDDFNYGLGADDPLKTLLAAQILVRSVRKYRDNIAITVNILPGIYYESLYLTHLDSGTPEYPIIWKGIGDGVILSSGQQIDVSSFKDCKSPLAKNDYPLKCANLKALNINDLGKMQATSGLMSCDNNKTELFYNNKPQIIARYPNIKQDTQMYVYLNVDGMKDTKTIIWKDTMHDNNGAMWSKETDAWLHGYWVCFILSFNEICNCYK